MYAWVQMDLVEDQIKENLLFIVFSKDFKKRSSMLLLASFLLSTPETILDIDGKTHQVYFASTSAFSSIALFLSKERQEW
jgi:hypothetical protein